MKRERERRREKERERTEWTKSNNATYVVLFFDGPGLALTQ